MEKADDIYREARTCQDLFASAASNEALKDYAGQIRSSQGDFNLWASSIKALSTGKASLDYRLRNYGDVRDVICGLLEGLAVSLQTCLNRAVPKDHQSIELQDELERKSPSSAGSFVSWDAISGDGSDPDSLQLNDFGTGDVIIVEHLSYVKTSLDQLTRISLGIRQAGSKYRFEKADAALNEKSFKEFRAQLTRIILRAYPDSMAANLSSREKIRQASDAKRLTPVQERLIHANVLRKHRIEWVTRGRRARRLQAPGHAESLRLPNQTVQNPQAPIPETSSSLGDVTQASEQLPAISISKPAAIPAIKPSIAPSAVLTNAPTATDVGSRLDVRRLVTSNASSKVTNLTRIGASQLYPHTPKFELDGSLICPYCDDVLPKSYAKNEQSWKAHVAQDILPYTCFMQDCKNPWELYLTAESLLAHIIDDHSSTYWTCDYCAVENDSEEQQDTNNSHWLSLSAEEWHSHVVATHDELVPIGQREVLAMLSKRQLIGPLECPLCDFSMPTLSAKIDDHILQHLHEFALWSLPEPLEEGGDEKSKASQVSGSLSHTKEASGKALIPLEYPAVFTEELLSRADILYRRETVDGRASILKNIIEIIGANPSDKLLKNKAEIYISRVQQAWQVFISFYSDSAIAEDDITLDMSESALQDIYMSLMEVTQLDYSDKQAAGPKLQIGSGSRRLLPPSIPFKETHEKFIGHGDLLDELDYELFREVGTVALGSKRQPKQQSRVVLTGEDGIGKTAIAIELVLRIEYDHPDCVILWVIGSSPDSIDNSYNILWARYSSEIGVSPYGRNQAVSHFLTWTCEFPWVMIVDDLQPDGLQYLMQEGCLPSGLHGSLIITSSDASYMGLISPTKTFDVPRLIPADSLALFTRLTPNKDELESKKNIVDALLHVTDGLPSAITAAAGRSLQPCAPFQQFVDQTKKRYTGQNSFGDKLHYVPFHELDSYWTASNIASFVAALEEPFPFDINEHLPTSIRILSVLVYLGYPHAMRFFVDAGLLDRDLPFFGKAKRWRQIERKLDYRLTQEIRSIQWTFCPVRFSGVPRVQLLSKHSILPIVDRKLASFARNEYQIEVIEVEAWNIDADEVEDEIIIDYQATTKLTLPTNRTVTLSLKTYLGTHARYNRDFESSFYRRDLAQKPENFFTFLTSFETVTEDGLTDSEPTHVYFAIFIESGRITLQQYLQIAPPTDTVAHIQFWALILQIIQKVEAFISSQTGINLITEPLGVMMHLWLDKILVPDPAFELQAPITVKFSSSIFHSFYRDTLGGDRITHYPPEFHPHGTTTTDIQSSDELALVWILGKLLTETVLWASSVIGDDFPEFMQSMRKDLERASEHERNDALYNVASRRIASTLAGLIYMVDRQVFELCNNVRDLISQMTGEHPEDRPRLSEVIERFETILRHAVTDVGRTDTPMTIVGLTTTPAQWEEIETREVQTFETSKTVLGMSHANTLSCMAELALTYMCQKRWHEALSLGEQVYEKRQESLGLNHPDTITSMANLVLVFMGLEQWDHAQEIGQDVIDIRKGVLGEDHPDTLTSMANLALAYLSQERWKEAENLGREVIDIKKRVLLEESFDTLAGMTILVLTYLGQERWEEAERFGKQVLEVRRRILGDEHPDTLTDMSNLTLAYIGQKRWSEAESLGRRAYDIRNRVLGESHLDSLISLDNLQLIYLGGFKDVEQQIVENQLEIE